MNAATSGPAAIAVRVMTTSSHDASLRRQPLAADEERVAPQHREDGRAELRGEVHPEAELGARVAPHLAEGAGQRPDLDPLDGLAAVGRVLDEQEEQHPEHDADAGRRRERLVQPQVARAAASGAAAAIAPSWPTMPVSWVTNGACLTRNHTATSRSSEVKIIASPAPSRTRAAMPTGNDPANANQNWPTVIRVEPGEHQPLRAEPVDQHPDRDLHRRVDGQLHDGEGRELGGADVEALGGEQPGDAQRGAVEDRQHVDRQADQPDDPRAAPADVVHLAQHGTGHRPSLGAGADAGSAGSRRAPRAAVAARGRPDAVGILDGLDPDARA